MNKKNKKKILTKEIDELQAKFNKLKNEIVVDIDTINKKNIQVIKSKDFESSLNNELLINEEIELNDKYNLNKEINNLVNLRYDQVINSLRKLCTEQSINYMKNISQNVSRLYNSKSEDDINQNQEENTNNNIDNVDNSNNNIENNNEENNNLNIEENKDENNNINTEQNNIQNKDKVSEHSSNIITLHEKLEYKEGEYNDLLNKKNNNNLKNENNDENNINIENNDDSNVNNNNGNINSNININDNSNINNNININDNSNINNNNSNIYNSNSISLLDLNEEKKLIQSYKEYLSQAEKTIDALFLMKSKNDFLQMIRDKAYEFEDANKTMRIIKRYQDKNKKSKINTSKSMVISKENSELEYCADDIENSKENEIQEKIFRTYMNAERRKMEKFINNEKEGRIIRNKDS